MPTEFRCPDGATAEARGTGVECVARDGKTTGDTFSIDGKTGLMVHPLGTSVAWADGVVSWFFERPVGFRVVYEAGKPARLEHYSGGDLDCARHFEGGRLIRRFDAGKWTYLDAKGRTLDPGVPLERAEIMQIVREHQPEVQLCYETRLHEVKGDFRGTIAVTVELKGGEAKNVKVSEDTLRDPPVSDCVVARISSWKFRPTNEPVEVTFPFVFKERR